MTNHPNPRTHEIVLLETSSQVNKRGPARKLGLMIVKPGFRPRKISDVPAGVVELVDEWDPVVPQARASVREVAASTARVLGFTELVHLRWEPATFMVRL